MLHLSNQCKVCCDKFALCSFIIMTNFTGQISHGLKIMLIMTNSRKAYVITKWQLGHGLVRGIVFQTYFLLTLESSSDNGSYLSSLKTYATSCIHSYFRQRLFQ